MPAFSSSQDIFDSARPWQWRVLRASLGTTTGLIVMAIMAKEPKKGIAFGHNCDIRLDGLVMTPMRVNGVWMPPAGIGSVESVRDNVRRLADHCKLSDAEREALFVELRKWVRKDWRAKSEAA